MEKTNDYCNQQLLHCAFANAVLRWTYLNLSFTKILSRFGILNYTLWGESAAESIHIDEQCVKHCYPSHIFLLKTFTSSIVCQIMEYWLMADGGLSLVVTVGLHRLCTDDFLAVFLNTALT